MVGKWPADPHDLSTGRAHDYDFTYKTHRCDALVELQLLNSSKGGLLWVVAMHPNDPVDEAYDQTTQQFFEVQTAHLPFSLMELSNLFIEKWIHDIELAVACREMQV